MNHCPNCGAALALETRYCPCCGASVGATKTRIVNIPLSRRDARRGCIRAISYPGAPAPIKVRLPAKLSDGAQMFLEDVPFRTADGSITRGALRLRIIVKRRRILKPLLLSLLLAVLIAFGLMFTTDLSIPVLEELVQLLPIDPPKPSATLPPVETPSPTPPPETPAPTPVLSHLTPTQQSARALIPHFENRYYLMELDDRLLANFCVLYSSVKDFHNVCAFPMELSREELANLMLLLSYECPELLQFSAATEMSYLVDEQGLVLSVDLILTLSPEETQRQLEACSAVAEELARETEGLSDGEKELFAYEFLTSRCYYDFNAPYASSAYGALVDGRAKCDGISLAMKWLCEEMGIQCMVIAGNAPGEAVGHAWNVLCIDGTYYDLDVTNDVKSDEHRIRYFGAYNVSRHWLRDQYPDNLSFSDFFILPGSESMDMSYHALNGCYVPDGGDPQQLLYQRLDQLQPGENLYLQFASAQQYMDFIHRINDIMNGWDGVGRGSFQFSLSHLDQFRVCCLQISFL